MVQQRWFVHYLIGALTLFILASGSRPVLAADVVVGDGTPASCSQENFERALQGVQLTGGGTINFDCGGAATIFISTEMKITANEVVIDGGGQITLDGQGVTRIFRVVTMGVLRLENIVLTNGYAVTNHGGAIFVETNGKVELEKSTIRNSMADRGGGAIIDLGGVVDLTDSVIEGNTSEYGALNSIGILNLTRTTVRNNTAKVAGGGISAGGLLSSLSIDASVFENNSAPAAGAILLATDGLRGITGSTFSENRATDSDPLKGTGGAILNLGSLVINDSSFLANSAVRGGAIFARSNKTILIKGSAFRDNETPMAMGARGGAIYADLDTSVTLRESSFEKNRSYGGGAISFSGIRLVVHDDKFTGNSTSHQGGAIEITAGDLDVERSEFSQNTAVDNGGAISCFDANMSVIESGLAFNAGEGGGGAVYSACELNMSNLTLSNNVATNGPGGAILQTGKHAAFISYATIAGNGAVPAGALAVEGNDASVSINRSILWNNGLGNCSGSITSEGYNFSNDESCTDFTQTGDKQNASVYLEPYGNNGGTTGTQMPSRGNEAIDAIPVDQCAASADQRQAPRPVGSGCDSGALEVGSVLRNWQSQLPIIIK